jgi:hypothetical protein
MKDINWCRQNVEPLLDGFEVKYEVFTDGDFGDLERMEFNSKEIGGSVRLWSSGVLEIDLVDYVSGESLMNFLLDSTQDSEKELRLKELISRLIASK